MSNQRGFKVLAIVLVVGLLAAGSGLGFVLGYARGITTEQAQWRAEEWGKLNQALYYIEQNYILDTDREELMEGALYGLLEALGDPYSEYLNVQEMEEMLIQSGGAYSGIGVEVTMENNRVTIIVPFAGSPAEEAGLLPGDQIVEVDGVSIEGKELNEAVSNIRGETGTDVTLGIIREGRPNIFRVTLTRQQITRSAVDTEMLPGNLGFINLTRFSEDAADEFEAALRDLQAQDMEGLVLDLRGNPGGYLDTAVKIAQQVVPRGLIVYTEDREGNRTQEFTSNLRDRGFPMVVLVNELSASASEILAGALQDNGVPVVGQNTFGKGTVQRFYQMQDGSVVKLTMARFFTPNGHQIQDNGVAPDYSVELEAEKRMPTLRYTTTLEIGSEALHVVQLQQMLRALGYQEVQATGIYDQLTADAVQDFQRQRGISATGQMDRQTTDAFNAVWEEFSRDSDAQLSKAIEVLRELLNKEN